MKSLRKATLLLLILQFILAVGAKAQNPKPQPGAKEQGAQAASGSVTGGGTPGRISRWAGNSGASTYVLGDSVIYEDKFGKIGIGTTAPTSPLTVAGMIETTLGGYKFPDGTVQTTAALSSIFHNATLTGNGTQGSPLSVAVPLELTGQVGAANSLDSILKVKNTAVGGTGTVSYGGDSSGNNNPGGVGLFSQGGFSANSYGGSALVGFGGGAVGLDGGDGLSAYGGSSYQGGGGNGVDAEGGRSDIGTGGPGVIGRGGRGGLSGGEGVIAGGGMALAPNGTGGKGIFAFGGEGSTKGMAGFFSGDVEVSGNFSVTGGGTKNFKIDHPLDPENKYLYHAAIESSEVLNIYSGNLKLDANGEAIVKLPEWFEAVNKDFRYTLTSIGAPSQGLYIAEEVTNNQFKIAGGLPGVKVSWQVTGIRSDAAILKHPFKLEEDKPKDERGSYLTPDAYGQPEERGVEWARDPQVMQQLKQRRIENEQARKPRK
jgi:hypothetical protein